LILDPFGQRRTVMTRVEDVSPEERDRRMAEWASENV
jgi:PhnB protein